MHLMLSRKAVKGHRKILLVTTAMIGTVQTSPLLPTPVFPGSTALMVELQAAAGDPLVSAAADIDCEGLLVVAPASGALSVGFDGKIDTFPAFEGSSTF
jgi:hypothetical protein